MPTTAAYVLQEKDIDKGRGLTFTRQENWWARDKKFFRGRFNPDRYRLEVIRDTDKSAEAFARGDLDLYPLDLPKFWYETIPNDHPPCRPATSSRPSSSTASPGRTGACGSIPTSPDSTIATSASASNTRPTWTWSANSSTAATPCVSRPAPMATLWHASHNHRPAL